MIRFKLIKRKQPQKSVLMVVFTAPKRKAFTTIVNRPNEFKTKLYRRLLIRNIFDLQNKLPDNLIIENVVALTNLEYEHQISLLIEKYLNGN